MRTVRFILASAAAVAALASCLKGPSGAPGAESVPIRLVVGLGDHFATRATGVVSNSGSGESKVNSLQVFVFNGDVLDGYGVSSSSSATVSCSSGERDIYCVVNEPSLSAVTTKQELLSQVASLSESPSSFGMFGKRLGENLQADGSLSVDVYRFAGRVVIKSIKNALENASQAAAFRLEAVYLTNVAGDVDYAGETGYTVTKWYNRQGYEPDNGLGSFTYDAVGSAVGSGETYPTAHCFYTMPNAENPAVGGEAFTPRRCRLVIKASIDGVANYYPILLPAIEGCKSYEINCVTITRPGNHDDDEDPEEKTITGMDKGFEVRVVDWNVVLLGDADGNITI